MRRLLTIALLSLAPLAATSRALVAQSADALPTMLRDDQWHVTLTIFRSPGTGVQVGKGHFAAFVAHYPTIIKREGKQRDTQFLRMGVALYARPGARTSPYFSLSFAPSLTKGWSNSALADVGVRQRFGSRYSGQLGVAVLYAPNMRETRVNPTIGVGVRF